MTQARAKEEEGRASMAACLAASGLGLTLQEDGSVAGDLPPDLNDVGRQQITERFTQTQEACYESAYGPASAAESSAADIPTLYEHLLNTTDCVTARGYSIGNPPSRDQWAEDMASEGRHPWTPFWDLQQQIDKGTLTMTHEEYIALYLACPQDGIVVIGLA